MKKKSIFLSLIISSLIIVPSAFADHHNMADKNKVEKIKMHHEMNEKMSPEEQKMHDEMLKIMKANTSLLLQSSNDMLDYGLTMLKESIKNKSNENVMKSVKVIKEGLELNQKVIKIGHSHNLESHEVMHKKHIEMHKKAFDTVMSASSELIKNGSLMIKEGKEKNDSELIMKGNSFLEAGMKILMMNPHHNEKAHDKNHKMYKNMEMKKNK